MEIGERLRELRKEHRLKQRQIAEYFGIKRVTYSAYETSKIDPPTTLLLKMANFYEMSIDELLYCVECNGNTRKDPKEEFLRYYYLLNEENREKLIEYLQFIKEEE